MPDSEKPDAELPAGALPPRPPMRGRYLIQSRKSAAAIAALDLCLRVLPKRRVGTAIEHGRILVANWGHFGDVVLTLPAIAALRKAYPHARIGMLVGSWARDVALGSGLIDSVHVTDHWIINRLPAGKLGRFLASRRQALREIRQMRYQVGIDFYPFFPPAHPLFHRAGIPIRVAFDSGGFGPLLTHAVRWRVLNQSISDCSRALVEVVAPGGADDPDWRYPTPLGGQDAGHLRPRGPYIVVHPGSGAHFKDWGEHNWQALIARLLHNGDTVVITGSGKQEEALATRLAGGDEHVVNLVGKTGWNELVATIAGAEALVCPDSAAAHVGALFRIPTVAIFTGTNNRFQWGPKNPLARVLVKDVPCAPCNRPGCRAMACIRGVTLDQVWGALGSCRTAAGVVRADEREYTRTE